MNLDKYSKNKVVPIYKSSVQEVLDDLQEHEGADAIYALVIREKDDVRTLYWLCSNHSVIIGLGVIEYMKSRLLEPEGGAE